MTSALPEISRLPPEGFFLGAACADLSQSVCPSREHRPIARTFIRDKNVPGDVLSLVAYRATFADRQSRGYGLHETISNRRDGKRRSEKVAPPFSKLGRGRFYSVRAKAAALDIYESEQQNSKGCWGHSRDRVFLPEVDTAGFTIVYRSMFDGKLTLEEQAVQIYVMAGSGKGPRVYAREIEDRFGWSRRTVGKIIARLVAMDKIAKHVERRKGAFVSTTYSVATAQKARDGGAAGGAATDGKAAGTRISPSHSSVPSNKLAPCTKLAATTESNGTDEVGKEELAKSAAIIACTVARSAMNPAAERSVARRRMVMDGPEAPTTAAVVRLSDKQFESIQRCHGDVEDLFDRAMVAKASLEARGKKMGSVAAYMVAIAVEDFKRANGVEIGVAKEFATGNRFQREVASKDIAAAWKRKLDGEDAKPKPQSGKTPNGSRLLAALGRTAA